MDEINNQQTENTEDIMKTETTGRVVESTESSVKKLQDITSSKTLTEKDKDIKINKEIAAASYVFILSIPIFIFRKDSPFIQKHARQGLVLFIFSLVAWMIAMLPYIGWIGLILMLAYLFFAVKGFLNALVGDEYNVPFITNLINEKLTFLIDNNGLTPKRQAKEIDDVLINQQNEEQNTAKDISKQVHSVLEEEPKVPSNSTNNDVNSSEDDAQKVA